MKKLTESEVAKFRSAKIITSDCDNFWTEYPNKKLVISEESLMTYLDTSNSNEVAVKIAENDLAGKSGRYLFNYEDIPNVIIF